MLTLAAKKRAHSVGFLPARAAIRVPTTSLQPLGNQMVQRLLLSRSNGDLLQRQGLDSTSAPLDTPVKGPDTGKSVPGEAPQEEKGLNDGNVSKSSAKGGKICLTFDDGPQNGTGDVLDVLNKTIKATFFLTGSNLSKSAKQMDQQEKLVRRILADGHQIGNHTFTHSPESKKGYKKAYGSLKTKDQETKFEKNFTDNRAHFKKLLGADFPGFTLARLPGDGRLTSLYVDTVEAMGLKHVGWEYEFGTGKVAWLPARDWHAIKGVAATTKGLPNSSDIVLCHDRHWAGSNKDKFGKVIDELKSAGFSFGQLNKSGKCS